METKDHRQRLLELIKRDAVFRGKFVLSSGKESNYYIDLRLVTLSAEGSYLIAEVLFEMLKSEDFDAIGGLTMGADPIAAAYSAISFLKGRPASAFIVRKEEKKHGKTKLIEGPLKKGSRVVIVDDVATSGGSLIKAANAVSSEGCTVVKVLSILDREEGAVEELSKKGYELASVYCKKDLGI
jgi:orotate phosphoribosyltransferase